MADERRSDVVSGGSMVAGRAAHAGSREEAALELYRLAEAAPIDRTRGETRCGGS